MKTLFTFLFVSTMFQFSQAQNPIDDAKSLLEASVAKTGGAKWDSIKTFEKIQGISGDIESTLKEVWQFPSKKYRYMSLIIGGELQETQGVMTDKEAWGVTTTNGFLPFPDHFAGHLYAASPSQELLLAKDLKIEFERSTDLDKPVYMLRFTKLGKPIQYVYDAETLLLIKEDNGNSVTIYQDYQEIEGVLLPKSAILFQGDIEAQSSIQYRFNFPIEPSLFDKATYQKM